MPGTAAPRPGVFSGGLSLAVQFCDRITAPLLGDTPRHTPVHERSLPRRRPRGGAGKPRPRRLQSVLYERL